MESVVHAQDAASFLSLWLREQVRFVLLLLAKLQTSFICHFSSFTHYYPKYISSIRQNSLENNIFFHFRNKSFSVPFLLAGNI